MHGFTNNYIRVEISNTPSLDNTIQNIRLNAFNGKGDAIIGSL